MNNSKILVKNPTLLQRIFSKRIRWLHVKARMEGSPRAVQRVVVCGGGLVKFGEHVHIGVKPSPMLRTTESYFEARTSESVIDVGDCCIFNNGAAIIAVSGISIGKRSIFGFGFRCYDSDFHGLSVADRNNPDAIKSAPVEIGDDCWIGNEVTILKGVNLGRGCVVGAGSVVCKSFPQNSLIAGNPARLVRTISQGDKC